MKILPMDYRGASLCIVKSKLSTGTNWERTAVHDAARVQVLQPRRDLGGDVQHLAHVCRVVLRPLARAQEAPVYRRLRMRHGIYSGLMCPATFNCR